MEAGCFLKKVGDSMEWRRRRRRMEWGSRKTAICDTFGVFARHNFGIRW